MPNRTDNDSLRRLASANPHWRLVLGDGQSTGEYFDAVASGDTKQLYIKNGSDTKHYGIIGINVRSPGEVKIGKALNPTEDTQGVNATEGITNKRSGGNGTTATARIGGDGETGAYSRGDKYSLKGAGGGNGGANAQPGETMEGFTNIVDPGDSILLEATNQTNGELSYISLDIDWVEIPGDEFY